MGSNLLLRARRAQLDSNALTGFEPIRSVKSHSRFRKVIAEATKDLVRVGDDRNRNSYALAHVSSRFPVGGKALPIPVLRLHENKKF